MTLLLGQIVVNFWWLDFRRSEIAHYRHFEIWNYFAHSQTRTEVWLWKFEIRSLVSKEASTGKFYCAVSLLEVRTRTRGENHGKQLEIVFWLCTIFIFFPVIPVSRALHTAHTTVDNSSNWIYYDTSETSSSRIESDRKSVGMASGVVYHLERNLKCRSRNAHTIYCPTVGTTPHHNAKLRAKLFSWDFKTGQCTKQARILLHYFLLSYQPWITALGILTIQIKYSISLKKNS